MIESSRINKYNEKGTVRGKLYISSKVVRRVRSGLKDGKVELVYGGRSYTVSLYRASRSRESAKLYIPKEVLEAAIQRGAEGAIIEVEKGRITILRLIKFCRICGRPTTAQDGLCAGRHFERPGTCVRCGAPIGEYNSGSRNILCDDCVRAYAQMCGLLEWFEPSPIALLDDHEDLTH